MDPVTKRFGQRLRALRVAKGWTQDQLAKAAGLDSKHVGVVERGQKSSSFEAVARLAAALKVDIHELFMPTEARPSESMTPKSKVKTIDFRKLSRSQMETCLREIHRSFEKLPRVRPS